MKQKILFTVILLIFLIYTPILTAAIYCPDYKGTAVCHNGIWYINSIIPAGWIIKAWPKWPPTCEKNQEGKEVSFKWAGQANYQDHTIFCSYTSFDFWTGITYFDIDLVSKNYIYDSDKSNWNACNMWEPDADIPNLYRCGYGMVVSRSCCPIKKVH